jgi:kynureninase
MARLVGGLPEEVVVMNSLTVNLHLMMTSFYRPTQERYKILIESKAFPSDYHAVTSQIQLNGFDPSSTLIELSPRPGEHLIVTEDIEDLLEKEGHTIALVLIGGVQYHSGQFFDLGRIATSAKRAGCIVGFDLAHAVGNVQLQLHDWQCDFAVWCSYKYLNCGPGSIGGCFVHQKHSPSGAEDEDSGRIRLAGWWGHRIEDRFQMKTDFIPCAGAYGFRLSNPPVLLVACVRASLDLFDKVSRIYEHHRFEYQAFNFINTSF